MDEPFVKNVPTKSQNFEFLLAEQSILTMTCKEPQGPESRPMFTRTQCCPSSAGSTRLPSCSFADSYKDICG